MVTSGDFQPGAVLPLITSDRNTPFTERTPSSCSGRRDGLDQSRPSASCR
jgi:hypothetical protein